MPVLRSDVLSITLKFMFSHASRLSHDMNKLSTRMYNEFVSTMVVVV